MIGVHTLKEWIMKGVHDKERFMHDFREWAESPVTQKLVSVMKDAEDYHKSRLSNEIRTEEHMYLHNKNSQGMRIYQDLMELIDCLSERKEL